MATTNTTQTTQSYWDDLAVELEKVTREIGEIRAYIADDLKDNDIMDDAIQLGNKLWIKRMIERLQNRDDKSVASVVTFLAGRLDEASEKPQYKSRMWFIEHQLKMAVRGI